MCLLCVFTSNLSFFIASSSFKLLFSCGPLDLSLRFVHFLHSKISFNSIVVSGKMQTPLPDLLKQYDLPAGIFPRDATNYEFNEETKKLTVFIPSICEVGYRDKSILRFSTTVTGYLEKGKFVDIVGIKTKFMLWLKVTTIASEGAKLHFTVGMRKTRDRAAYEVLRDGITVDKF